MAWAFPRLGVTHAPLMDAVARRFPRLAPRRSDERGSGAIVIGLFISIITPSVFQSIDPIFYLLFV